MKTLQVDVPPLRYIKTILQKKNRGTHKNEKAFGYHSKYYLFVFVFVLVALCPPCHIKGLAGCCTNSTVLLRMLTPEPSEPRLIKRSKTKNHWCVKLFLPERRRRYKADIWTILSLFVLHRLLIHWSLLPKLWCFLLAGETGQKLYKQQHQ